MWFISAWTLISNLFHEFNKHLLQRKSQYLHQGHNNASSGFELATFQLLTENLSQSCSTSTSFHLVSSWSVKKMSVRHFYVTVTSCTPFISFLHLSLFHHRCRLSPHLCLAVCLLPNPPTGFSGLAASYISPVKALVPQMPKLLKSLFPVRDDKKDLRPSPHSQQVWSCFQLFN